MFALRTIIALACVGFSVANHQCPADPELSMDLDQDVGIWYMVAGSPPSGNKLSYCSTFNVSKVADDEFLAEVSMISHKSNKTVHFDVNGVIAEDGITATWKLRGSLWTLGPFRHVVVHRDEQFLITIMCSDGPLEFVPNGKFSMVWSRERHPSAADLEDLQTKLADYIDKDKIRLVRQENC